MIRIIFWLVVGPVLVLIELAGNPGLSPEQVASQPLVQQMAFPNIAPLLFLDILLLGLLSWPLAPYRLGHWFVPLTLVDRHRAPAGRILLVAGREPAPVALRHVFLCHSPADRLGIPVSLRICVRVRANHLPGAGVTLADPRTVDGAGRLARAPGSHDDAGRVCDGHARLGAARTAHGPGGGLRPTG